MRTPLLFSLSAVVIFSVGGRGLAEDEKPDYTKKTISQWIDVLKNSKERESAAEARKALGPSGPYAKTAIPALIDALDDDNFPLKVTNVLAEYGSPAIEPLIRAMKSPKAIVRRGAMGALEFITPRPTNAIPALIEALKDRDENARYQAIESLATIGIPGDKATLGLVAKVLKDDSVEVRCAMLHTFWSWYGMGGRPAPPAAIPLLIDALNDKNPEVRDEALDAIAPMGPSAKDAAPALIEALRSKEFSKLRTKIVRVLGCIGPAAKAAVPDLLELLKEGDVDLRNWTMGALGGIGTSANAAVPEILKVAQGKNKGDRCIAIRALGGIGPDAKDAVPTLIEALNTDNPDTDPNDDVLKALRGIGPAAKAAVPALVQLARDHQAKSYRRRDAALAVISIDPENTAQVDMEIASLSIDYLNIRQGKIPAVKLGPRPPITEEKKKQIKSLIAKLAEIRDPDFGTWVMQMRKAFLPVFGQKYLGPGLVPAQRMETSNAFLRLVELGPEALPFLLESLDDKTPTHLTLDTGLFLYGRDLDGNYLNAIERRVLSKARQEDEATGRPDESIVCFRTVRVGDLCFVAIGQIVGRPYNSIDNTVGFLPDTFSSPAEVKLLRDRLRDIWNSDDPTKRLMDSLLLDYATEAVISKGESLDTSDLASTYQIESSLRLLYYFPKETAPLIAARLQALDVKAAKGDDWTKREVKNGVDTLEFIRSLSWCKEPRIQEALVGISKRTNDKRIKEALGLGEK